jgi:PBSX family phage terminase large subunit
MPSGRYVDKSNMDQDGYYTPNVSDRQLDILNDYHRFLLVHGPRKSGKSVGILHKIVRHCVENKGAQVAIVARSKTTSQAGVWKLLTNPSYGIIATWIKETGGLVQWVQTPRHQQDTKTAFCTIRNMYGGESEIQLHSINVETLNAAEDRFKDTSFSMIYIVEADKFKTRVVYDTLTAQLRSMVVPFDLQQIILDTNPPDEGDTHWLHDVFFKTPTENHNQIFVPLDDNPYLDPREKDALYDAYKHDENMLARYFYGKWVKTSDDAIFSDVWNEYYHLVEVVMDGPELDNATILRPNEEVWMMESGWDLGDVNSAVTIGFHTVSGSKIVYHVIDELVYKNSRVHLTEIAEEFMEKQAYWNSWMLRKHNTTPSWTYFSDTSSLRFKSSIAGDEAAVLYRHTDGVIRLSGVKKGANSVAKRVDLLKRMLHSGELFVSGLCQHTVDMLRFVKPPPASERRRATDVMSSTDPHKHVFDALTYMISYGRPFAFGAADSASHELQSFVVRL